jgi:hypothetical protein
MDGMKTATQMMTEDWLFRRIVQASVSEAMHKHGRIDPERAEEAAYEIAMKSVQIAVARMIEGGDGLAALIIERDAYRKMAETALAYVSPVQFIVAKPEPAQPA